MPRMTNTVQHARGGASRLGSVLLALAVGACATAGSSSSRADAEQAAERTVERLITADNAADLAGVLACYAGDVLWLPPDGEVIAGKAGVRPRYERLFASYVPDVALEVTEVRASDALAYVRGFTRGVLRPKRGGEPTRVNDKFLAVLHRDDGAWRISHLMWSPTEPAH
jgi:uncharacterized protein (TIGR02246 family)